MDLSIIIVNWNSVSLLRKCLESIYAHSENIQFEIVVVDNASWDGSQQMVQESFPEVVFIQSEQNLGFAGANTLGAEYCKGRNLLFLNPDTEFNEPVLESLISVLDRTLDAAIVGPKLLNSDLTVQTSCIARFPSILNLTLDSELLRRMFPHSSLWGMQPLLDDSTLPVPVDVVVGASLMIKAKLFKQLGGFDNSYFMYAEDVDLCFSANERGWKTYYVPSVRVVHHGGSSSGAQSESHFSGIVMRESILRFLRRKRGPVHGHLFCWLTASAALLRLGLLCIGVAVGGKAQRMSRRIALRRWIKILRWSMGLEHWAGEFGKNNRANHDQLQPGVDQSAVANQPQERLVRDVVENVPQLRVPTAEEVDR